MGCGASSSAHVVDVRAGIARSNSSPKHVKAKDSPYLRVQTLGLSHARAVWSLPGKRDRQERSVFDSHAHPEVFSLEMEKDINEGFSEIYRGEKSSFDIDVQPGCSLCFRVALVDDNNKERNWSNLVSFVSHATVPPRPDPPRADADSKESTILISWNSGVNGGREIDNYDLQMFLIEADEDSSKSEHMTYTADIDHSSTRIIYHGNSTEYKLQVQDLRSCGDFERVRARFRLQASNEMGCSPWSDWSNIVLFSQFCNPNCQTDAVLLSMASLSPHSSHSDLELCCDNVDKMNQNPENESSQAHFQTESDGDVAIEKLKSVNMRAPDLIYMHPNQVQINWEKVPIPEFRRPEGMLDNHVTYVVEMERRNTHSKDLSIVYDGKALSCAVSGLSPGCSFTFKVRAKFSLHASNTSTSPKNPESWLYTSWSPGTMFVTPVTAPDPCTGLQIKLRGPGEVELRWDEAVDNGSVVEGYLVQAAELSVEKSSQKAVGTLSSSNSIADETWREVYDGPDNFCVVTFQSIGGTYRFRVCARNSVGIGPWGEEKVFVITALAPGPPPLPTLLNCLANSVDLSWQYPDDRGSKIRSYVVQMKVFPMEESSNRDENLQPGGDGDNSNANPIGCKRSLFDDSRTLKGRSSSPSQGTSPMLTSIKRPPPGPDVGSGALDQASGLYMGDNGSMNDGRIQQQEFMVSDPSTRICTIGDINVGMEYRFRVRAVNEAGPGDWSDELSYVPECGPPAIRGSLELSSAHAGHICAEWEAADGNGLPVEEYVLEMSEADLKSSSSSFGNSVEVYRGPDLMCNVDGLSSNKRMLLRLKAVNAIGESAWSEMSYIDIVSYDNNSNIEFTDIELGEVIGEGGFSVVHKGTWKGMSVAVKKLKIQYADGGDKHADEFRKEVQLLSNLRHRNVVRYMGASLQSPDLCVLTELLECSMSDLLYKQNQKLKMEQVLGFARDVAKGVKYLHSLKPMIIHRDLKSSNLLVDSLRVCKISDFGLSRIKDESVTKISGMLGTPGWSAPEIYKQDKYTEKVDMYSYGVVLSEMVTGEKPYAGLNQMQIAFATVYQGQRPSLPDSIPKQLKTLIKSCWDSVPSKRPSWDKILDALRQIEDFLTDQRQLRYTGQFSRPPKLRANPRRPSPASEMLRSQEATALMGLTAARANRTPVRNRPESQSGNQRPQTVEAAGGEVEGSRAYRFRSPSRSPATRKMGGSSENRPLSSNRGKGRASEISPLHEGGRKASKLDVSLWPFADNGGGKEVRAEEAQETPVGSEEYESEESPENPREGKGLQVEKSEEIEEILSSPEEVRL